MESEEDPLALVTASADVGLPGIGDRVYQNMVLRFRVRLEIAGHQNESFCKWTQKKNNVHPINLRCIVVRCLH